MRNPGGYFICVDPDPPKGKLGTFKCDTATCQHCSHIVRVKAGQDVDDVAPRCSKCGERICQSCKARGTCQPIDLMCEILEGPIRRLEATIRQNEDRGRFLREVFGAGVGP